MPPGYQSRIRPRVASAAPAAPADLSIARGIADLGDAAAKVVDDRGRIEDARAASDHRIAMEQQRRDRSALIADRAGELARVQGRVAEQLDEARNKAAPGAPDWQAQAQKIVDDNMSPFVESLGDDPEVVERFTPLVANWGVSTIGRERDWGTARKAEHERNGIKNWYDQRVLALEERGDLNAAFGEYDVLLDGLDMDGTDREQLRITGKQGMVERVLSAQIAGGRTEAVREALKNDSLKPYLTSKIRESLNLDADRADERKRIADERAAADAAREARKTVDGVQALLDQGAEPTAAEMKAAESAVALLDPKDRVELAAMQTQLAVNRETRGMGVDDIRHRRDFLRSKVDAGKATQGEQMMLSAYGKRLDAAEDREAEESKLELGQGVPGRIAAVERLQQRDPETRFRVGEKTEEGLGFAATLPASSSRRQAIEGADARKNRKDLFDTKAEQAMRAAFRSNMGRIANGLQGSEYAGREGLAMDLYAAHVVRSGIKDFDPTLFWQYQNIAFGATRRGDGKFQGGLGSVNGGRVELPQEMSQEEFRSFVARSTFGAAVDGRGVPVSKSFITTRMVPQLDEVSADGRTYWYKMVGPSGATLQDKDGRDLRLPVPRRGTRAP